MVNWNQSSDQKNPSTTQHVNVPSHGSSTHSSTTRLRPGSLTPGGTGVDVKHNSYSRYLLRLKGGAIRASTSLQAKKSGIILKACKCTITNTII